MLDILTRPYCLERKYIPKLSCKLNKSYGAGDRHTACSLAKLAPGMRNDDKGWLAPTKSVHAKPGRQPPRHGQLKMKRNLLLLSASAAVCLAWPLAGVADPRSDQAQSTEQQGKQPPKQAHAEGAHQAPHAPPPNAHQNGAQRATASRPETAIGRAAPYRARSASPARQARTADRQPGQPPVRVAESAQSPAAGHAPRSAEVMALRRNVQATRRFHADAYRAPEGYAPRHWGYGEQLPGAYFAQSYWITDFSLYALMAPPEGLVWVRVGDDVMLIDRYSGEIIQVDYGYFD